MQENIIVRLILEFCSRKMWEGILGVLQLFDRSRVYTRELTLVILCLCKSLLIQVQSLTEWFNKLRYYFIVEIKNQATKRIFKYSVAKVEGSSIERATSHDGLVMLSC